jgi:enamine deaminase RidA (YjgF/YER057c/UK114 family)
MSHEARARELQLELDAPPSRGGNYVPFTRIGELVYVSGSTSAARPERALTGRLGDGVEIEEGQRAARLAAENCVANLRLAAGTLDRVRKILRLTGYVNATPGFTRHPEVMDGASDFLVELFGDCGTHARTAVGVASLPRNAAVEVELIAELAPDDRER